MTEIGIGMTIEDYHENSALSNSGIKEMQVSPLHYWTKYRKPRRQPFEASRSMRVGQAFHVIIGEPELVDDKLAPMPEGMIRRGKAWDEFSESNMGKNILSHNEWTLARNMAEAMRRHPMFKVIADGGAWERSFFWGCPITGASLKTRPDLINLKDGIIFDFKSTEDIVDDSVIKNAHNFNYRVQAALALDGLRELGHPEIDAFYNVYIEQGAPYSVVIYEMPEDLIEDGRRIYQTHARIWAECETAGEWPGLGDEIRRMRFPPFYKINGGK